MKLSKNIPYILIIASIILLIFDASRNGFLLSDGYWERNIVSILLIIVGLGLLYIGKKQK